MATVDFAARAIYQTYQNGSVYTANPRRIGYSNTSGTNKYVTVYKFTMPVVDGTITSITLNPYVSSAGYAVSANKTWQVGIAYSGTNTAPTSSTSQNFADAIKGNGALTLTYRTNFTNGSSTLTASDTTTQINCGAKTIAVNGSGYNWPIIFSSSSSTQYLYLAVFSAKTSEANLCKIAGLTGYITYTPTTYSATKGTCTYATASVSPTSGTSGTSFTFTASSYANDDNYIYGGLTYTYGNNAGGGLTSPYASGYGAKQTITNTGTYSSNFTYTASASRYPADPARDDVTCTISNVTSSSVRVRVPSSGITTTFLGDYYYITATDCKDIASGLTGSTGFSRTTGYVNLTGLTSGTTHKMYVYAYNSYNERYYKISTVEFATDQSNYSATISANATGATTATVSMSGLSSTTNLDSYWYLIGSDGGATMTSISNYFVQSREGSINLSTITAPTISAASLHTVYAYVKSSASGVYYRVGSATFKTHSYIYYGKDLTPCWTYMLNESTGELEQVLLNVPSYVSS